MTRKTTDPLRVRLDTTAPRPTFVDDPAGDYLVSYAAAGMTSDLLDELHAFFMGLLAGHDDLRSAAIIEFDRLALRSAAPAPEATGLREAVYWQLALAKSIEGLVEGDTWEVAAAIKGRLDSRGVVLAAAPPQPDRAELDVERWMEVVSDALAATTEGTDWAEAPEPSDEPGSPYVRRLTNEILARLSDTEGREPAGKVTQ